MLQDRRTSVSIEFVSLESSTWRLSYRLRTGDRVFVRDNSLSVRVPKIRHSQVVLQGLPHPRPGPVEKHTAIRLGNPEYGTDLPVVPTLDVPQRNYLFLKFRETRNRQFKKDPAFF